MSDLEDEDAGFDTDESPRPGKKRANHNELERKRRQHQKDQLNGLRDAVPFLRQDKPSTVLILARAKDYIDMLTKRVVDNEKEINRVLEQHGGRARPPDTVVQLALHTPGTVFKHEDVDALRQENAELKAQLEHLQKSVASPSRTGILKKDHGSPYQRAPQGHSPGPAIGSPAGLPTITFGESPPAPKLGALAQIAFQEVEGRGLLSATGMHDEPGMDMSALYRKRKSYADNDFEAAKRAYHSSRRNSSFDILQQTQEDQQRLHVTEAGLTEAGLLQNFVRRASLPSAFFDGPPPTLAVQSPEHDAEDAEDDDDGTRSDSDGDHA